MALAYLDRALRGRLGFLGAVFLGGPAGIYLSQSWGWTFGGQIMLTLLFMFGAYWVIWLLYSMWASEGEYDDEEFEVVRCPACGYIITEPPPGDSCPSCDVPLPEL